LVAGFCPDIDPDKIRMQRQIKIAFMVFINVVGLEVKLNVENYVQIY
jgi:hypothetical protein